MVPLVVKTNIFDPITKRTVTIDTRTMNPGDIVDAVRQGDHWLQHDGILRITIVIVMHAYPSDQGS